MHNNKKILHNKVKKILFNNKAKINRKPLQDKTIAEQKGKNNYTIE